MMDDWDFDNLVVAHNGTCIGGAKNSVMKTLLKIVPILERMVKERKEKEKGLEENLIPVGTTS